MGRDPKGQALVPLFDLFLSNIVVTITLTKFGFKLLEQFIFRLPAQIVLVGLFYYGDGRCFCIGSSIGIRRVGRGSCSWKRISHVIDIGTPIKERGLLDFLKRLFELTVLLAFCLFAFVDAAPTFLLSSKPASFRFPVWSSHLLVPSFAC